MKSIVFNQGLQIRLHGHTHSETVVTDVTYIQKSNEQRELSCPTCCLMQHGFKIELCAFLVSNQVKKPNPKKKFKLEIWRCSLISNFLPCLSPWHMWQHLRKYIKKCNDRTRIVMSNTVTDATVSKATVSK